MREPASGSTNTLDNHEPKGPDEPASGVCCPDHHPEGRLGMPGVATTQQTPLSKDEIEELQFAELPDSMRTAQRAVQTDEVQEIIERLAKYNLGVCMPHMHPAGGGFAELPGDVISLEQKSSFIPLAEADPVNTLAVAWHWKDGAVTTAASCHVLQRKCDGP